MKKVLSLIIALIMAFSMICLYASAAGEIPITGSSAECQATGHTIVSFSIPENSGLAAVDFILNYDSDNFKFVSYTYGPAFEGGMGTGNDLGNGVFKYGFIHVDGTNVGGEMFNVTFKASDKVKAGESYKFELSVSTAVDAEHNSLNLKPTAATVKIIEGTPASNASIPQTADTEMTNSAQHELNTQKPATNGNDNGGSNGGNKSWIKTIVIIALVGIVIIAAIVIIVISTRKQKKPEEDVMTSILADDADIDSLDLENDELDETISVSDESEFDE